MFFDLSSFFFVFFCFSASHEGSPGGEEVPLSTVWLQMQVGDAAEVPHDQTHRYQQDVKADHYILIRELLQQLFFLLLLNHVLIFYAVQFCK